MLSGLPAIVGTVEGVEEGGVSIDSPGQVTILRMDAGTELGPHCGPRNSRLTAHLPLIVPSLAPDVQAAGVRVGEPDAESNLQQWRLWEEGNLLIFVRLTNLY